MVLRSPKNCGALLTIAAAFLIPLSGMAQASPAGSRAPSPSFFDISIAYGYFHPVNSDIYGKQYGPIPSGGVVGLTGYFNRWFGLQAEFAKFPDSPDYCMATAQGGPVFRHPMGRLVPFAHVIGGGAQISQPYIHNATGNCNWGWAATAAGGIDYILPGLNNHLALRPVQADFAYADVNFGNQTAPNTYTGGAVQMTAYQLSAGLVFRLAETTPEPPAAFGCEAHPATVYPGDPVSVTGSTLNLEASKKLVPVYTWASTGGRISGGAGTASIATSGLAAGDYTVTGKVSEGTKPSQHAECSTSFRVMAFQPPTIDCSADPASILPGGFSTVTAMGRSPQNLPLTYSFGTSAGQITASGTTATLAAAGVPPGVVKISCNVVDDKGNSASATSMVSVVAPPPPPPPPAPATRTLCSIAFDRDKKRPVRVDNEAKGCLDDIATELYRNSDAVLVVVGKHDPREKPEAAAERTLNEKQYLTDEKGIAPNRIQVRTGETAGRTVDNVLVPPGATWDSGGTTSFDPATVQRHGQAYAPAPNPAPASKRK